MLVFSVQQKSYDSALVGKKTEETSFTFFLIQQVLMNRRISLAYIQLNSKGYFKIKHCTYGLQHTYSKERAMPPVN